MMESMPSENVLNHLKKVQVESLTTLIVKQIRDLVKNGILKPGDRLPSESAMSKQMGVNRLQLREAMKQLEFYGLFRTVPQSGTFLTQLGPNTLDGLFTSFLHKGNANYQDLMEVRAVLELKVVEMVVEHASKEELLIIENANEVFTASIKAGKRGLDEDIFFHLKLAEFSHNGVLESVLAQLYSEIVLEILKLQTVSKDRLVATIDEHALIISAIRERDSAKARDAMDFHMGKVREMSTFSPFVKSVFPAL